MSPSLSSPTVARLPAKVGAWLFALWGLLHVWVGAEGVRQYLTAGTPGLWSMLIGGASAPRTAFVHATDPVTLFAHGHLILNFCLDVGGYGVLGFFVAWMILRRDAWLGYLIGLVVIGICDLAFFFSLVVSGVIQLSAGTVGGPVLWFLAVAITPFGLPSREIDSRRH
jgi:hypothetical protein